MIGERIEVNLAGELQTPLPLMATVKVRFEQGQISDVKRAVAEQFARPEINQTITAGMRVAVGCGSRGVANIADCVGEVIAQLKALGAKPFIFPAMGSHGSASAQGQRQVLESYRITELRMGCKIVSSMDTIVLGQLSCGTPVHADANAAKADGIVLINRIKPHTTFRAPIESGIAKMMAIGMGKINGANTLHTQGMDHFERVIPEAATLIMGKLPFLFGVGLVENAYDATAIIEAIPAKNLLLRETELQAKAKEMMGRLFFPEIDVLIIDEIGKNISGAGFDPNITGRNARGVEWEAKPSVQKIVLLGLTKETHGNATGLGVADIITMRLFKEMEIAPTYANTITSKYLDGAAIPVIMNTQKEAVQLAIGTLLRVKPADARVVRIKNTLEVANIQVSQSLGAAVREHESMELTGPFQPIVFDENGDFSHQATPAA